MPSDGSKRRRSSSSSADGSKPWKNCAAISINPYNGGWFFNIGLTLDEMGRFEEAIDAYRKALEIETNDLQALPTSASICIASATSMRPCEPSSESSRSIPATSRAIAIAF